jgi:AcrR family transcriptional regulator
MKSEKTKENIIANTIALIRETNGDTASISIRKIAERANVGTGLINHYFATKENLLEVCVQTIISEIGTDMSRFPSADHLASWAGVSPGNHQSAGKRGSGKTSQGNKALGAALNQAAHAASRTKNTYLAAQYHRLAARRGKPKAIVAVMHSILVMAYHMIQRQEPYRELGGNYFDQRRPEVIAQRLVKRLEKLGFQVSLQQAPAIVAG